MQGLKKPVATLASLALAASRRSAAEVFGAAQSCHIA
jgi:hypothetical protein